MAAINGFKKTHVSGICDKYKTDLKTHYFIFAYSELSKLITYITKEDLLKITLFYYIYDKQILKKQSRKPTLRNIFYSSSNASIKSPSISRTLKGKAKFLVINLPVVKCWSDLIVNEVFFKHTFQNHLPKVKCQRLLYIYQII